MFKFFLFFLLTKFFFINFSYANIEIKARTAILQDFLSGEILYEKDIKDNEIIRNLSSFHVWSDSYIQERRNWKPEKPMKAVFLKTVKIPEFNLPLKPEFSGCKSWIELNSNFESGELALSDNEINDKLEKFKEIVA